MNSKETAYLFVYFAGETEDGEQVYFSVSRDGLHWEDLNQGMPVLTSPLGEKGVRDPFILRSVLDKKFYIMATDLRIASGTSWEAARSVGSKKIILWSSIDLIHWSNPWEYEVPLDNIGCVWAPEAYYDRKREEYLTFWASLTQVVGELPKHKIFCAYTKDFHKFSSPKKYIEKEKHLIDTTIVAEKGIYYRFTKDAATDSIKMDYGNDLQGVFTEMESDSLNRVTGVEGPLAFLMPDGKTWCLMVDQFAKELGYLPLLCENLSQGKFTALGQGEYNMGKNRKRHGSVLAISQEEYERVCHEYHT